MKKIISVSVMLAVMVFSLAGCASGKNGNEPSGAVLASTGKAPDYFQKESWYKLPEITKDVDTFYIYSTAYFESSFKKGAPDYAPLDDPEMREVAHAEYITNASVYEGTTNVFIPYYRQAGMRYAVEVREKTGSIDAALAGVPYEDIRAALDCYFEHCNQGWQNGSPLI